MAGSGVATASPSRSRRQGSAGAAASARRWPRRVLLGINVFLALCIVLVGSSYAYVRWRYGQVQKLDLGHVLQNEGQDEPGSPMNVLLVGSDTRKRLSVSEQARFGTQAVAGGERSDTIMILHADPRTKFAAILSIPRDLWINIDGRRSRGRINEAFHGKDGPERLIRTIRNNLGIEIDHYAQVDFIGFRGIVKAVGGVKVWFPAPARDRPAGLDITSSGCVTLDGEQALAYVRARNYQSKESGSWRYDPTSDFGRMQRQQDFIRRILRTARGSGIPNPGRINKLIDLAVDNVKVDRTFTTKDAVGVANSFKTLDPDAVEMITLPTNPVKIGGADVLQIKEPDAQQIIDRFNGIAPLSEDDDGTPRDVLPAEVRVQILNGTGRQGQASGAKYQLRDEGFAVAGTGDADSFRYIKPVVRYAPGQKDKALLLRSYIAGGAQLREDRSLVGGDLVLILGSDFGGVRAPGKSSPSTSTSSPVASKPRPAPQPRC